MTDKAPEGQETAKRNGVLTVGTSDGLNAISLTRKEAFHLHVILDSFFVTESEMKEEIKIAKKMDAVIRKAIGI